MKPTPFLRRFLAIAGSAALVAPFVNAITITWDANAAGALQTDGAGDWTTASQWWNGAANVDWTSGDDAIFGNGGVGGAVTLASPTTLNSLTFNAFTGTYTLGTVGQTITLNNGITKNASGIGAATIISPITLGAAQSWTNNSAGLLTIGTGAVDNAGFLLTVGGTGNTTISSAISGAGGLTKSGAGRLTLSGTNGYTGGTILSAGTLILSNTDALGAAGQAITLNGGMLDLHTDASVNAYNVTVGGNVGIEVDRATSGAGIVNALGTLSIGANTLSVTTNTAHNVTANTAYGLTFGATTLTGNATFNVANNGTSTGTLTLGAVGGGAFGLSKSGAGTLNLTGANTYTGTTTISGGTLNVGDGTTGSLNGTTGTALTFNGNGGTANFNEAAGVNQGMGVLTFSAGEGTVQSTYAGSGNSAVTFSSLAARTAGATGNFVLSGGTNGTTNQIKLTRAAGFINSGVYFNGANFAAMDAVNTYVRELQYGTHAGTSAANALTSGTHALLTASSSAAAVGLTSLKIDGSGVNWALASGTLITTDILKTGGGNSTISGGNGVRGNTELVIRTDAANDQLTISGGGTGSIIATAILTKAGAGTLTLNANDAHTGATYINGGTLEIGGAASITGTANAASVFIATGANFKYSSSVAQTLSGVISGAGSVTMSGTNSLTLNTGNTYSGGFTLNSGTVSSVTGTYGGFGTGKVTWNGGTIALTGTTTIANDFDLNGATLTVGGNTNTLNFGGVVTLKQNINFTNTSSTNDIRYVFNNSVGDEGNGYGFTIAATGGSSGGFTFNAVNTFTGNITIGSATTSGKSRTLIIGGSGSLNSGNYAGNITNNNATGSINYSSSADQILSGVISAAALVKDTSSTSKLTLSGGASNTLSGLTTVSAGTLELNKSGAFTAIQNGGLTIGGANNTAAAVRYTGASSNMMGTGTVTINGRGILDFNGKTDTIGNVAIVSTGATDSNPSPIINTAGGGNLTIGTLGITPVAGFTSVVNAGTGTITLGDNVTFNAAGTGQAQITGTALALGTAGRIFTVGLGTGATQDLLIDAQITGAQSLTKAGAGRLTLQKTNGYSGGTTVSAGTLLLSGAFNMPGTGTLAVSNGGTFSLADGTARATTGAITGVGLTLATGSWLAFDWNGASLDSFTTTGTATSTGTVVININNTSPTGSGGTLITSSGVSTLNSATYLLANNTNYTATISKTTTTVSIGAQTPATALTDAYWKGDQVTGALGTMTVSTGSLSNWASDAAGTSVGVIPRGSAVNVIFGATGAAQQANVTTGLADMNLGSITFNDSAAVTIAGSPNIITLNSNSGTAAATSGALQTITNTGTGISAISVTSFANATNTISANLALGANQTWNVASGKTLVVSGIVSGTNTLTKADSGKLTLTGANTYTGTTTISAGTLQIGNTTTTGSLSSSSAIVNNSNLTFNRSNAVTQGTDFAAGISGTGSVTQAGSSTLTLSGTNSYNGGTVINAGTLAFDSALSIGGTNNTGGSTAPITVNGSATMTTVSNTAVANLGTGAIGINNGSILTLTGSSRGTFTIGGAVTGDGGVTLGYGSFWGKTALNSTSNTFQGALTVTGGNDDGNSLFSINSIADGAGYGNIILNVSSSEGDVIGLDYGTGGTNGTGGGGAITPLVLNHRQIVVQGTSTNTFNNASNQNVTINTDIGFSGTGARSMRFGVNARAGSGINTINGKMTDNVGGAFTPTFSGGTWNVTNTNTYTGGTSVSAGILGFANGSLGTTGTINASGGTLLWLTGNIQDISSRLAMTLGTISTFNTNGNDVTFGSAIGSSNTGAFTKAGAGTLTLSGANTYTGATTVTGGILRVNGSTTAGSAVTVSGGAIGGTGTIGGSLSLTSFGGINLADGGVETLNITGILASTGIAQANNLYFDLASGGSTTDQIIAAGAFNMTTSGAVIVNVNQLGGSGSRLAAGTYDILTAASGSALTAGATKFKLTTSKAFGQTFSLASSTTTALKLTTTQVAGVGDKTLTVANGGWDAGATFGGAGPEYDSNVTINSAVGTTPLNGSSNINSLTYGTGATTDTTISAGTAPATVGASMLVIEANGGNGITVNTPTSGTPIHTISTNIGLASNQTWTVNTGAALVDSGRITDFRAGYGLTKAGAGILTLSGTNTYSGNTLVSAGTLQFAKQASLYSNGTTATWTKTNINVNSGATMALNIGGVGEFTKANVISLLGLSDATTNGFKTGATLGLDTTSGNFTYDSAIANPNSGNNVLGLTKLGANKLTLNQVNTYTGTTTITTGTLALSGAGSIASSTLIKNNSTLDVTVVTGSTFTIGAAQTYGGTGTLLANTTTVVANGTLSPGNSPGTVTQDGGVLQLGANANYNWQIVDGDVLATAGLGYDTVNLINGATLDLSLLSAGNPYNINLWSLSAVGGDVNGDANGFNNTLNHVWTLFSTNAVIGGFATNLFDINVAANNGTSGFSNALGGGSFSIGLGDGGTDIVLNFTVVPEPGAVFIGSLGLLALLRRRRN